MELSRSTTRKIILILFAAIAFCIGLINLGSVWNAIKDVLGILSPIILGLCIAFLLSPLTYALENRLFASLKKSHSRNGGSTARALSVLLSIIIVTGIIALLALLVVPEVQDALTIIGNTLPAAVAQLISDINILSEKLNISSRIPTTGTEGLSVILTKLRSYLQSAFENGVLSDIASTALSVAGRIVKILLGLIFSIYVLMQKEKISSSYCRLIKAYTKEQTASGIFRVSRLTSTAFRNFVTGQLTEAMIIAMLCFFGMLIFRFPYPTATSAIVGVMALIPVFGSWIGAIIGALLSLSDSFTKALLFILFFVILQQIEGDFIYPKVVGKSVGLPSILVFISVIIGAGIGGILGMILSIPLCSVLSVLIRESVDRRLAEKKAKKDAGIVLP